MKAKIVLGITYGHPDSSACLFINNCITGAIAEERFGQRLKHDSSFPINSIRWLIENSNIKINDITDIAIAGNKWSNIHYKLLYGFKNFGNTLKHFSKNFNKNSTFGLKKFLSEIGHFDYQKLKIHFIEHHLCHISSAYYLSGMEDNAIGLSVDGSGDFVSTMITKCQNNNISIIKKIYTPNSLGHFYSAICQYIGFPNYGEEYKVMGLASYGKNSFQKEMQEILSLNSEYYNVSKDYINPFQVDLAEERSGQVLIRNKIFTKKLDKLFNCFREKDEELQEKHIDIAKSAQFQFENAYKNILANLKKKYSFDNLVLSGGCALNGVNNQKILENDFCKEQFIQPASSDDGLSLGAALYVINNLHNFKFNKKLPNYYLGTHYSNEKILKFLKSQKVLYEYKDLNDLLDYTVEQLLSNKIIGWFQGRGEWGPRALGNRSILANPFALNMKEIINTKIKRRENFRPFAPSILEEDVNKIFKFKTISPNMMHVVEFRDELKKEFPSVVHIDGTGRLQTVNNKNNEIYYKLLIKIKEKKGYGIILNTSFNENEPIVESPNQAYDCFIRTDMDILILGNYVISK